MKITRKLSGFVIKLFESGVSYGATSYEKRKIQFTNISFLFSFFFVIIYILVYSAIDFRLFRPVILALSLFVPVYLSGIVLSARGSIQAARHVACSSLPATIIIITYFYLGTSTDLYFYLIAFGLLPIGLWTQRNFRKIFFYLGINLAFFAYFHLFFKPPSTLIEFPPGLINTFSIVTILLAMGTIAGILWLNIRFTELHEVELIEAKVRAEESNLLKSRFLANMSHEIRTPLNGILGFLNLLQEIDVSSQDRDRYIAIVNKSGDRLLDTINEIIEMSKIETGGIQLELGPINSRDLRNFFEAFFKQQADEKGLSFEWCEKLGGQDLYFISDRYKLEAILTNLIKNAIKFTLQGGIEVGHYIDDNNLVFYVMDSGIGIHSNKVDIIFERFIQANNGLTRPHEGSGLGLSISRAYAEMLGGKIWVKSELGQGSTFYFSIPYQPVVKATECFGFTEVRVGT